MLKLCSNDKTPWRIKPLRLTVGCIPNDHTLARGLRPAVIQPSLYFSYVKSDVFAQLHVWNGIWTIHAGTVIYPGISNTQKL